MLSILTVYRSRSGNLRVRTRNLIGLCSYIECCLKVLTMAVRCYCIEAFFWLKLAEIQVGSVAAKMEHYVIYQIKQSLLSGF